MKRVILLAAACAGTIGVLGAVPAQAAATVPIVSMPLNPVFVDSMNSTTSGLLNLIPGLGGPSTRNICLINDAANKSYCILIPLP